MRQALYAAAFAFSAAVAAVRTVRAELVLAEPELPVVVTRPAGAPNVEVQVVLQVVVDREGHVESAVVVGRAPADAPSTFDSAARDALTMTKFKPSQRDGQPIRSRVEYVVVFHADAAEPSHSARGRAETDVPSPADTAVTLSGNTSSSRKTVSSPTVAPSPALSANEQDEDYVQVEVRGTGWASPRGIGDLRIKRELLEASPRQQTSEMLSAAPGFFVDHEEGEGFGNDVYLRGFDLEHGSGIEMRVGTVPINNPVHVHGQGYADANFIIPEVVRSIRVLEGPYDPRQGDAAIVGSAYFDLGVRDRGNSVRASYGSWNQLRLVGVSAPRDAEEESFAAFSVRRTDGFGARRASEAGSANAQYAVSLGERDRLRLLGTAHTARAKLPGVLRRDDVQNGSIGWNDSYPYFTNGQGVQSSRVIVSADFDHLNPSGARFEFAPWVMWTNFRSRRNYTGNIYSSALDPALAGGQGDLWEMSNREMALGLSAHFHGEPLQLASWLQAATEVGLYVRSGRTEQSKSLLNPDTLLVWDRRLNANLDTLDAGAYFDLDVRAFRRLRLAGGVRADFLNVTVSDRLAYDVPPRAQSGGVPGSLRASQGLPLGPRVTLEYELVRELTLAASYGEGFRSLGANASVATSGGIAGEGPTIQEGAKPFSKIRSAELGMRARIAGELLSTSFSLFETRVENELVFEATSGGFSTEGASRRRGFVASAVAKPFTWLLASTAMSVSSSTFTTLVPGVSHFVPNVPPILFRADVTARGRVGTVRGAPLIARTGVGYTFLAGRHLTDKVVGPSNNVLNASAALRYASVEVGLEAYNLLNLHYADEAEYYVSNWSLQPGTPLATPAIHVDQAPPLTVLGSVSLYF